MRVRAPGMEVITSYGGRWKLSNKAPPKKQNISYCWWSTYLFVTEHPRYLGYFRSISATNNASFHQDDSTARIAHLLEVRAGESGDDVMWITSPGFLWPIWVFQASIVGVNKFEASPKWRFYNMASVTNWPIITSEKSLTWCDFCERVTSHVDLFPQNRYGPLQLWISWDFFKKNNTPRCSIKVFKKHHQSKNLLKEKLSQEIRCTQTTLSYPCSPPVALLASKGPPRFLKSPTSRV